MPANIGLDDFMDADHDVLKFLDQISSQLQGSDIHGDEDEHYIAAHFAEVEERDFGNARANNTLDWEKAREDETVPSAAAAFSLGTEGASGATSRTSRLREQNRLAQARFRLKKKQQQEQLERQILQRTAAITSVRIKVNEQQVQNRHLMGRNNDAATALLDFGGRGRSRVVVASAAPAPLLPELLSVSVATSTSIACKSGHRDMPLTSVPSCPRPVSSYRQHASLSCAELVASSDGLSMAEMLPNLGLHLRVTRAALAARMGFRAGDVCWHLQCQHAATPDLPLSFSAQLGSLECLNSFLACWLLDILESAFLTDESDDLSKVVSKSAPASQQASSESDEGSIMSVRRMASMGVPVVGACQPEEPACQNSISALCRCGVNQTCAVTTAIPHALLGLLAKYAGRVPEGAFILRCDQFHRFVTSIQPRVIEPSGSAAADTERGGGPGQVPMQAIVEGMTAVLECMGTAHDRAVASYRASPEQVATHNGPLSDERSAAMGRNNADLSQLGDMHCFTRQTAFLESKKWIRQVAMAICLPSHGSLAEVEHVNVATYNALGITWEQARLMQLHLRCVGRHRSAMNAQYAALATSLAAIPSAAAAPPDLLRALVSVHMPVMTAASTAEDCGTRSGFAVDGMLAKHEWARCVLGASAAATAAAVAALERLWSSLEDELTTHTAFAWMAHHAPYLTRVQAVRFKAVQLAMGAYVVDNLRMCQLAAQDMRRGLLFKGKLL